MTTSGVIFNIQRYSIHDGPGIRTTVFMKGCPLNCTWCANPESKSGWPQIIVRDAKCVKCGACVDACPKKAITLSPDGGKQIQWLSCDQCLKCAEACLYDSINVSGEIVSSELIVDEVLKDSVFYKNSGGGVTISGGEPLMQHEFTRQLLKALKLHNLHTALDTSGYALERHLKAVLPYVDLLLFDLKQIDSERHRAGTGKDNGRILSNLRIAAEKNRTWIRIPLIRNFNDSPDEMRRIVELACDLGVEKISLLPFHDGGSSKAFQIGEINQMSGEFTPEEEAISHLCGIIENAGIMAGVRS